LYNNPHSLKSSNLIDMKNEKDEIQSTGLRISRTALPDVSPTSKVPFIDWKAEQFLKVIQQDALEMIFVVNLKGDIKFANDAVKSMLGHNPTQLLDSSIQKIISAKQWVSFRAAMRASEEEADESIKIDCQFLNHKNKKIHFSLAVKDQRHHPLVEGYVVHAKNIDRLKKLEEQLKLRNIAIEAIKEAIVIISLERPSIIYANEAFFELSGFSKQDILSQKINVFRPPYSEMLFSEPTPPKTINRFLKSLKSKRKFEDRIFSKRKNGQIFYNRISVKPIFNHDAEVTQYVVSMKEIVKRNKN